ncbi:MAG: DUF1552 domain-containing protein [Myxococcota bacterium]
MVSRKLALPRRTFLRGLGGAAVALPTLEIMLDDAGEALAGGGAMPLRYLVCFGGFSIITDGDPLDNSYIPATTGPGYTLGTGLAPLGDRGVQDLVTVVSGLSIPSQTAQSENEPIPPAGRTVHFHAHVNPVVSGMRSAPWTSNDTHIPTVTGPSSDQIVAEAIGDRTSFRSLAYRAQALLYNTGTWHMNRDTISYRDNDGEIERVVPVVSPRQAYDALFLGFVPDDPQEAAAKELELDKRRSVLDLVDRRMDGLLDRLGSADRQRLEQHYDEIRALEMRLEIEGPEVGGECQQLPDPGSDPPLGGEPPSEEAYDVNAGYSDEQSRLLLLCDLMHMAFTCDLTRVGSLMFTMFQSFMNVNPITGHAYGLHDLSHNGDLPEMADVIAWHVDHFAYLVERMRDTPEGAGSLLDSCALMMMNEAGGGVSYENGSAWSAHSTDNMVTLVAGGAGGLRQGHHIVAPSNANHPGNVVISAMEAVGVNSNFGEVSGSIPELFG